MLDIRYIREHADEVAKKAKQKGYKVDINKLLKLDKERRQLQSDIDDRNAERRELSQSRSISPSASPEENPPGDVIAPSKENREQGKEVKAEIAGLEAKLMPISAKFKELLAQIPNIFPDDTPLGGEEANKEIKNWGVAEEKDAKDHLTLAEERGFIDFERGAKVAGNKFYFLKTGLVELDLALLQFAINFAKQNGFWLMGVPHMVNTRTLEGAGFSARGAEKQVYKIEDEDLNLIATAEIPLTGHFTDEIMPEQWLPSKMAAWSPSYRVEGGAYGRHNRGLYRVHQFNKVELYVLCKPEQSEDLHQQLLELEENICQELEIPYRVVRIAAGDLGAPAYKKFDIEYWSPADKAYRELMSCSNVTDYQARRLNIRYKNAEGKNEPVHTLNATLAATSRLMIALIENHQTEEGKIAIPKALQSYMNGQTEI